MPNDPKTSKPAPLKEQVAELRTAMDAKDTELAALRDQVTTLTSKVEHLTNVVTANCTRLEIMEVAAPAELRALNADALAGMVQDNPYARLEILEDWAKSANSQFRKGAIVRADHVPHLVDYVRHGLKVGIPQDQAAQIAKLKAEHAARLAAAEAEGQLAKAQIESAEARMAAARAEAIAAGG